MMDGRYFVDYSTKSGRFETGQLQQSTAEPELRASTEHFFETLSVKKVYSRLSRGGPTLVLAVILTVLFILGAALIVVSATYRTRGNNRLDTFYDALNNDLNDNSTNPATNRTSNTTTNTTSNTTTNSTQNTTTNNTVPAASNTTNATNQTAANTTTNTTQNTTQNATSNTTQTSNATQTSNTTNATQNGTANQTNTTPAANTTSNQTQNNTSTNPNTTNPDTGTIRRLLPANNTNGIYDNTTANYDDYYYGTLWLEISNATAVCAFICGVFFLIVLVNFAIYTGSQKRAYFALADQENTEIMAFTQRMQNRVSIIARHEKKRLGCCSCFWIMHFRHEVFFRDIESAAAVTTQVRPHDSNPYMPFDDEGEHNTTNNDEFGTAEREKVNPFGNAHVNEKEFI